MGAWNPWENPDYFWVVICKNAKVHREANLMSGHKIALGETDTFAPLPVTGPFVAVCDEFGAEFSYAPTEVLRLELGRPASFTPHPLFK